MTDKDIELFNKLLLNAYIELCKAEKLLKQKGSDNDGKTKKIPNSR